LGVQEIVDLFQPITHEAWGEKEVGLEVRPPNYQLLELLLICRKMAGNG
jgi:hypothetical protein